MGYETMDSKTRSVVLHVLSEYKYYDDYESSFNPDETSLILDSLLEGTKYIPFWEKVKDSENGWTHETDAAWCELESLIRNDK